MANSFSSDSNCKALWRFESGALTTDSKGTNTLTAVSTPASDTGDYKEGAGCVDYELGDLDSHYRTDANLDAGFPLKSGDTNKKISVCFWYKPETVTGLQYIFSKYNPTGNLRSFAVVSNIGPVGFYLGYSSGVSFESTLQAASLSAGTWYHVGITFQDSDKSYRIRVWNGTADSLHEDKTGNTTNNISITTAQLNIGSRSDNATCTDGKIDELVVFDDILTSAEIDQIRAGTYGAGAASAAITGTATASITEADIVTGGKTIIITLTGDTWIPS